MKQQPPNQASGASETTRFFVPRFRQRRVPQASYAQPEERSQTWPTETPIRAAAKLQFLQTSTMPNPHISPNLTTLGRGNVPVARNPIPKPHKRQNQTIRKNNTIPQLNFHSSWGLAPDVLAGIMAKLEASNRAEAVAIALRKHLL